MRSAVAMRQTTSGRRATMTLSAIGMPGTKGTLDSADAAIGKIDRCRRLRRAADADQDDIGFLDVIGKGAIVVSQCEVQRVDPLEIVGVHGVLGTRLADRLHIEEGTEHIEHGPQHVDAGNGRRLAGFFEPNGQILLHQRIENNARSSLDVGDDALDVPHRSHQGIDVLDGHHRVVLRCCRPADGEQRLAGGVRDEVDMKIGLASLHGRRAPKDGGQHLRWRKAWRVLFSPLRSMTWIRLVGGCPQAAAHLVDEREQARPSAGGLADPCG